MIIKKVKEPINQVNQEHLILLSELEKTKSDLEMAQSNFENVTETDLIDCCIYELKAVQLRYKFLLKKAKEINLIRQ